LGDWLRLPTANVRLVKQFVIKFFFSIKLFFIISVIVV